MDLTMVSREFDRLVVITLLLDTDWFDCAICFKIVIISPMIVIPRSFKHSCVRLMMMRSGGIPAAMIKLV